MKRVLLDQGVPFGSAEILREQGWDALHVREIGMRDAPDQAILDYAARESRVVITLDRDFPQILALMAASRPSVVLIRRQRLRAAEFAQLIETTWEGQEPLLDRGCILKISDRGTRTRMLPLK